MVDSSFIDSWIVDSKARLSQHRRHIHAHPELSFKEVETTAYIATVLRALGLNPQLFPTSKTGLWCDIGQSDQGCDRLAIRADIDALPIAENTGLDFSSHNPGVSHSCGHDVHTSILLGVAEFLVAYQKAGHNIPSVRLIFQPAEEVMPGGALAAVADGALTSVDSIIALHCDPKLQVGQIGLKVGAITSAADRITVRVQGPGGHTSRPHVTVDVVGVLAALATHIPTLLSRRVDPRSTTIMVWGAIHAGQAPNAIPDSGYISGTVRTSEYTAWLEQESLIRELVHSVVAPFGAKYELDYQRGVPPVVNDAEVVERFRDIIIASEALSFVGVEQSGGGEDFSWYTQEVPGAMVRLGTSGAQASLVDLHRSEFNPDEGALSAGVELFIRYILAAAKG